MKDMSESIGYDKAFNFAARIVKLYRYLCDSKKEYVLSKQILRSGTSIGANIKEALQAQSKRDYLDNQMYEPIHTDCVELIKILVSIIKTTRSNL